MAAGCGDPWCVDPPSGGAPPANPVLRYLAILSAARDFGVSRSDVEQVARRFDPHELEPWELAGTLANRMRAPASGPAREGHAGA
jgi:hypothetical protein